MLEGGTAADAAVAVMAVLNVCEPWASSAAGNGLAIRYDKKTGKIISLAFTGAAPRLVDDHATVQDLTRGPKAIVTPGSFGGWIELIRRFGRLPLSKLLEPAIDYARDGHPIDPSILRTIERQQARLAVNETRVTLEPKPRKRRRRGGHARRATGSTSSCRQSTYHRVTIET